MMTTIKHTDNWGNFMEIEKCPDGALLISCTDGDSDELVSVNVSMGDFMIIVGQVTAFYGDGK